MWAPIFGNINPHFYELKMMCNFATSEMVGHLCTWTDLNETANLINKRGIDCNDELILIIGSFCHINTLNT